MGKPNKNKNKPQPPAASASAAEQPKKPEDQAPAKQPGSETPGKIEQAQQATTPVSAPVPVAPPILEKQGQPGSQTATSEKAAEKNVGPAPQVPSQSATKIEPKEVKSNLESVKQAVLPPTVKAEEKPGAEQKAKEITSNAGKVAGQEKKKEQNPGNANRNQGKQNNKEQPKPNADKAGGKGKQKDNKATEKPRETLEDKSQEAKVETPVASESTPKDAVLNFSEIVSEKAQAPPAKLPEVVPEKPKEPEAPAPAPLVPEKPKQEGNQEKPSVQQQQQKKNAQNNNRKRTNSRQKTPENSGKAPGKAQEQPVKAVEKVAEKPQEKPVKAEENVAEKLKEKPATPAVVAQEKPSELLPKPAETSPEKLQDSVVPKVLEVQNQDATNKIKADAPKSPPANQQSGKQDSKNKSKANQQGKGQQNQNKVNSKGPQTKTPEPTDQKAQETIPKLPEPVVAAKLPEVAIKAPEIVGVTPKDPATKPKEADAIKAKQSPPLSSSPGKEAEKGKKQPAQSSNPTKDSQSKASESDKKRIESPKSAELEKVPEKESQNKPPEKAQVATKSEQETPPIPEKNQKGKKQDQRKPAAEKIQEAKKPAPSKPPPASAGQKTPGAKQEQSQTPVVEKSEEKKQTEVPISDKGPKNKQKDKASPPAPAPEKLSENKKQQQEKITPPVVTNVPETKQDKPQLPVTVKIAEAPKKPVIKEVQNCAVCNKVANSRCGGCNNVNYCSKDHQKQHWKKHKGSCIAWKICTSPELGRYLAATRDIRPGEIIIQEKPLLLTPPKVTAPVCLSCYHELLPSDGAGSSSGDKGGDEDIKPCVCEKNCGWPLCSSSTCKQSRGDHEPECSAGANRGGVKVQNFGQEHPMYQAVGILRALDLQKNRPADFENFMSLQSSDPAAASADTPTYPDINVTVKLIRDFFQYSKQGITEEMVKKISGIIDLNGHEIPIPGNYGQINRRLIGVYYTSSFLEHNCRPNCTKTWDSKTDSRSIVIRSAIPIKKGEHLSISYVDPLWGTNDRQHFLQMTKFFTCKCSRCLDPTELGCHISSVRCQQIQCSTKAEVEEKSFVPVQKRSGMIVPVDPLNGESPWKCLTCNEQYPVKYASSIVDKIASEMEKFQEMRGDIAASEDFLKKFSKVLPPYHFFLLEIKVELAQLYGRTPEEPLPVLAPIKLLRKKVLCEELLQALNVIVPGLNRLRALILYELQATVGTLSKIKASVGDISAEMHFRELQKCHAQLSEVVRVLDWEPRLSVEYRRCDGAKRELADLAATLADFSVGNEEIKTPSLKITSSNAQAENIIPVAASRDRIDKLAAQSKLDDDELELF